MTEQIGAWTLVLILGLVLVRVRVLRSQGVAAMKFGRLDKRDFLIPPFAILYFYTIFGHAFGWSLLSARRLFDSSDVAAIGALSCILGIGFFAWSLLSFGASFRVGIDVDRPDALITSGAFSVSRNPIYVAFLLVLAGEFLIFPNWIPLIYVFAATWLIHRQIGLEEDFLRRHYGADYAAYCSTVRRYI